MKNKKATKYNTQNLKPFKKGKDLRREGNGRPKKLPSLEKLMPEILGDENDKNSELSKIMKAVVHRAKFKGGDRAVEILLGYGFGRPKQSMDINVADKEELAKKFPFGK